MPPAMRLQSSLDRFVAHADRDVRLEAVRCVARLSGPALVAKLRALADDPDPIVRRAAITTLAERAPAAGRAILRAAFTEETDLECRRAALRGLVAIGDTAVRSSLRRLIRNPDAFIYEASPASQAVRQALCCEAVQALSTLGDASVVPDLVELLERHVSAGLDQAVVRTLAELGDDGRPAIAALIRNAPTERARSALEALADAADSAQTDALAMFLSHTDDGVRVAAAAALARVAPSHSALLRRVADPSPDVRALVAAHAGPTMPSILEILIDDPDPAVSAAALGALARVPETVRSPDLLWRVRGKLRAAHPELGASAAATLAAIAPDGAAAELTQRLHDAAAPTLVRVASARALATLPHSDGVPALAAELFAPDPQLRNGVLEALIELAGSSGAARDAIAPVLLSALGRASSARAAARSRELVNGGDGLRDGETAWHDVAATIRADIARRLGELPSADIASALATIVMTTSDELLKEAAASAMCQIAEQLGDAPAPAVEAARHLRGSGVPALRRAGLRTLASAPGVAWADAIAAHLEDSDAQVRAAAIAWIGAHAEQLETAVVERVEAGLSDHDATVRVAAIGAVARVAGRNAVARLIDSAVRTGDEHLRTVAACFAEIAPDAVEHELARRLAMALSRDRQLALLRLSDAILSEREHAAS